ncbi:hypothetical protein [Methylacidimicrobium sp. B4]|uniref:hypothetical protein n=1 Tax=Methylacidimicrobium sp. B4 TaxID=2796139 RepID=UPI001A8E6385|nr:hypothetical protein [Methylacidimicrobium sp. B4]QSR85651.1 hypothetical protein MacB4_05385 [Methylacidimicrobium sp. B4]
MPESLKRLGCWKKEAEWGTVDPVPGLPSSLPAPRRLQCVIALLGFFWRGVAVIEVHPTDAPRIDAVNSMRAAIVTIRNGAISRSRNPQGIGRSLSVPSGQPSAKEGTRRMRSVPDGRLARAARAFASGNESMGR